MILLIAVPREARAQSSEANQTNHIVALDEARVIELARSRSPKARAADASEALGDSMEGMAAQLPNPTLGWERETAFGEQDEVQDMFRLNVPLNLAQPLSAQALGASNGALMKASAALSRSDAVLAVLFLFYDVVLGRQRVTVLEHTVASFDEAARVLKLREEAGTASGYESMRLSIASELAHAELAEAEGILEGTERALNVLLGLGKAQLKLPHDLTLRPLPDEAALIERASTRTKALEQAEGSLTAARTAQDRAAWSWVPQINLMGGLNRVDGSPVAWGYLAGVSFGVPIFNAGGAFRDAADARAEVAAARKAAISAEAQAGLAQALAAHRRASKALERLNKNTTTQREQLLIAAQSGYREGRRTIVELIDAQRARTDAIRKRLRLLEIVKKSEAQARAAAGEFQ